jgi:Ca2+-binding RTX toxin-like protein
MTCSTGGPDTDTLLGGTGNDRYIVDNPTEALVEPASNSGIDTIESGVSRTLGDRFENLVLTGAGAPRAEMRPRRHDP